MSDQRPPAETRIDEPIKTFPGCLAQLAPMVTETFVGTDGSGDPAVVLKVETVVGMLVLMFEPEHAARISREFAKAAASAKSGLTIAHDLNGVPRG